MIYSVTYILVALSAIHLAGFACLIHAILNARSPQGSVAWACALLLMPYVAVPLYLVFGRSHFLGYRQLYNQAYDVQSADGKHWREQFLSHAAKHGSGKEADELREWEKIFERPFLGSNRVSLLIDGPETFAAIEQALVEAKEYIFFQFYIIRDDRLGGKIADLLIDRARAGIRVYCLYDEIGSAQLSSSYIRRLKDAGVRVSAFNSTRGRLNKLQLNFRNHRKIVVVDGSVGFVGGHNVGDEYLGESARFGKWHDLHIKILGPENAALQLTFIRDWYWATRETIDVKWDASGAAGDAALLTIASGPADELDRCTMMFLNAINTAQRRVWIISPYFVPDDAILLALQTAALRGVDVRVLLPKRPDHILVWLASFAYIPALLKAGARVFRYPEGFLHAKAFISDEDLAMVGTPNLDNRSLRLNFEIAILISEPRFCGELHELMQKDFATSEEETKESAAARPFYLTLAGRFARLLSPIL